MVAFVLQLNPWVIPPAAQDSGNLGPAELLIRLFTPPHVAAKAAHPVPWWVPPGATNFTIVAPTDGTAPESWHQVPGYEGYGSPPPPSNVCAPRTKCLSAESINLIDTCSALCSRPHNNSNYARTLIKAVYMYLSTEYCCWAEEAVEEIVA